jgi:hypothetical protein
VERKGLTGLRIWYCNDRLNGPASRSEMFESVPIYDLSSRFASFVSYGRVTSYGLTTLRHPEIIFARTGPSDACWPSGQVGRALESS